MIGQKIRVGIIGVQLDRSWAAMAHVPALQSLAGYEITAVSTTRQVSADAAAARYGIPHAFDNAQALVSSPDVDVVVVAVKLAHHLELVTAAIRAGKHVYCEWPLGNGLAEAETMAHLSKSSQSHAVIGLQARFAPALAYVRDLVAQGYVGDVLSTSLIGTGMNWGEYVDAANAYTLDLTNGVTMLTVPVAHTLDAVCHVLGEVVELSGLLANRRRSTIQAETHAVLPMTSQDQVGLEGTLENGVVFSLHYRGGMSKGTGFLWEINGTKGDLRVTSPCGLAQIFPLSLSGVTAGEEALRPLDVPEQYFHSSVREGPALNVAELYLKLERDLRDDSFFCPGFDHAVRRHRMIAAIERSAELGVRQVI